MKLNKIKTTLLITVLLISTITIAIPLANAIEDVDYSLSTTAGGELNDPVDIVVTDDGTRITWTIDYPIDDDSGNGLMTVGLIIALDGDGEAPAFQIHNNDGTDATFDWGTWLYSPYYDDAWHSGDENTLVTELDWVSCTGGRYHFGKTDCPEPNPNGVFTITIDKSELGNDFHWALNLAIGSGFYCDYEQMSYPAGETAYFDWGNPIVDMSVPNYARALAVTGSGSVDAPSADTTVDYEGADDDKIIVEDLTEDEVEEATFGAVGEYVDVQLEEGTSITELEIRVYYEHEDIVGLDESQLIMYWYDGTNWAACSDTGVETGPNYIWAIITDDTSPSLSQMTGTPFGPGGGLALDSEFYKNVDVIIVDVGDSDVNLDPIRIETIEVKATSNTDLVGILVELSETDVDTGLFTGSFPITDVIPPPVGYLAVDEGDTVTVLYVLKEFTDTAVIDETAPIFDEVDPIVGLDFYKNGDTITLTIGLDDTVYDVTADFSAIDSECTLEEEATGAYIITYDISEDNTMADGEYIITVTAEDEAGNSAASDFSTNLDNTMPSVTDVKATPAVIQPADATTVTFTASVSDALSLVGSVTIDLSEIGGSATQEMTEIEVEEVGTGVYEYEGSVEVALAGDYILLITATDTIGNENALEAITFQVILDTEGPFEVGFTEAMPVCGGIIVRGLYMKDLLTGPGSYKVLVNDEDLVEITETELISETLISIDEHGVFKRSVILDLPDMADPVSVTLIAYDLVGKAAEEIILYEGLIPDGEWCPVDLYDGWNLVSLPLIPDSSDSGDVLSLILDQGASGVVISYDYDQYTDTWITNPTEMTDGYGYWLYMLDDDVMIVEGIERLPAPALPQTYEFTEGWVLAGYKQTADEFIDDYLASLQTGSYFGTVYTWDATLETPAWDTLSTAATPTDELSPGMGFWIWMYSDQNLIAPLE